MQQAAHITARTAATMHRMEQAALGAGADGIRSDDLAALLGLSHNHTRRLAHSHPALVQARTRLHRDVRWFHAKHQADADAYVARINAIPTRPHGPSHATRLAVVAEIERAGRAGITVLALQRRLGLSPCSVHDSTAWAGRHAGVQKQRIRREVRFYGRDVDLAATRHSAKPAAGATTAQRAAKQRAVATAPRTRFVAGPSTQPSGPATSVEAVPAGLQGLVLKPGAKVTVVRHTDPRAEAAAKALPLFSALRPGRYLDHDTAIARAYGGHVQPTNAGR